MKDIIGEKRKLKMEGEQNEEKLGRKSTKLRKKRKLKITKKEV